MIYKRIDAFPDTTNLEFPELRALSSIWWEKRNELEGTGAFQEFIKKLKREWAIETGIIERLYTWDRGVTEVLIEQGIEAAIIAHEGGIPRDEAEHIKDVIEDHLGIVEGLFSFIKDDQPITEHFIRQLQAKFTEHQEFTEAATQSGELVKISLLKGEYKVLPNNPKRPRDGVIHAYCPPEFTKEEMERLVSLYREAEKDHTPELNAAWLHHRFTQIHPFQDGNGRVARALTSLIFLKADMLPLVIRESDRKEYIGALEAADEGDLSRLVSLFASRQREAILKVIGLEQQVQQGRYASQIIASAVEILRGRSSKEKEKLEYLNQQAKRLLAVTESHIGELAKSVDDQISKVTPLNHELYGAWMNSADNSSDRRHYFQKQIVEIANQFGYFANLERFRAWARLSISTEARFDVVVSFHGYGYRDTGIFAASAFTYVRASTEDGLSETVNLHPSTTDLFQFNYVEPSESVESRFREWLDSALTIGLAEWKKML